MQKPKPVSVTNSNSLKSKLLFYKCFNYSTPLEDSTVEIIAERTFSGAPVAAGQFKF